MGCDIHPVVQVRVSGQWQDVSLGSDRSERSEHPVATQDYEVFSVLADVRNQWDIVPIGSCRGVPYDFQVVEGFHPCLDHSGKVLEERTGSSGVSWSLSDAMDACQDCIWMGEHSYTWVSLQELLDYNWDAIVHEKMTVLWVHYVKWVQAGRQGFPQEWCASASGSNVVVVAEAELPSVPIEELHNVKVEYGKQVYVKTQTALPLSYICGHFCQDVIPWLQTLGESNDVRIVMGSDS